MRSSWFLAICALIVVCAGATPQARARRHVNPPPTAAPASAPRTPAPVVVPSPPPSLSAPQISKIDQLVHKAMVDQRLPGLSLAIARNGGVAYAQGYGYRNSETHDLAQAATLYPIGQLTHQFTAVGILLLQQDGKLSLDDPLARYLADFPRGSQITLRDLLGHTSGLHDYTALPGFGSRASQPASPAAIAAAVRSLAPDFPPATGWSNSRTDGVLLGLVIEKVSALSYRDYLYQRILKPAGMSASGYSELLANSVQFATGYTLSSGRLRPALPWDLSWGYSAAGMVSNAPDIALWDAALLEGNIVSAGSLSQMFGAVTLKGGVRQPHAFGADISAPDGRREVSAAGGWPGFSAYNALFPDNRLAIVILTNRDNFSAQALALAISRLL
jgi:CubicO group peptidase (beta-lactamase class C family)